MRLVLATLLCALQVSAAEALSLQQAVERAATQYPSIRVSNEQVAAAAAAIDLARTVYLPRADVLAQFNRATHNNVFGLVLPQSVIPSISGPVLGTNTGASVWGSAVGFLVSWEPFDFGLRRANIETAEAGQKRAEATVVRTKFEVAAMTADAYLTALAARETARAARAQVDRARKVNTIVEALAKAELRPGADASRNRAEIAVAEGQLIQAEQAVQIADATLKQMLGADVTVTAIQSPASDIEGTAVADNPYAREQKAVIDEAEARRRALDRAYYPRFNVQASSYARGTGVNPDGSTGGTLAGIGPNIQNWALGMTVTFPVLELPSLRARRTGEEHRKLAEEARYDQLLLELNARIDKARAALAGARRMLTTTPAQLQAARASERQATARYGAGLGTLIEVADAQRVLTQAEIDDSLARLNIWRAMLGLAAAQGDLQPFLERVK